MADDRAPDLAALRRLNDSGYLYYRDPKRVRADDLMVRAGAADCLHRAAALLALAEQKLRRAIPAPSREIPFPDPALLAAARGLKALQERIATLETRLRGAAALPDRDFSAIAPTEDLRNRLVGLDAELVGHAAAVETAASGEADLSFSALLDALAQAIDDRSKLAGWGRAA
jgi:hypothetical protein